MAISTRLGRPLIVMGLGVPLAGTFTKIRHEFWLTALPRSSRASRAPDLSRAPARDTRSPHTRGRPRRWLWGFGLGRRREDGGRGVERGRRGERGTEAARRGAARRGRPGTWATPARRQTRGRPMRGLWGFGLGGRREDVGLSGGGGVSGGPRRRGAVGPTWGTGDTRSPPHSGPTHALVVGFRARKAAGGWRGRR